MSPELLKFQGEIVSLECELRLLAKKRLPPKRVKKNQQKIQRLKTLHADLVRDQHYRPVDFSLTTIQSSVEEEALLDTLRLRVKHTDHLLQLVRKVQHWTEEAKKPSATWRMYWYLAHLKHFLHQVNRAQGRMRAMKAQWLRFIHGFQKKLFLPGGTESPFEILKSLAHMQEEVSELKTYVAEEERRVGRESWNHSMTREALENKELLRAHKSLPYKVLAKESHHA